MEREGVTLSPPVKGPAGRGDRGGKRAKGVMLPPCHGTCAIWLGLATLPPP